MKITKERLQTYPLKKLYFMFLRPEKLNMESLPLLVSLMYEARFIDVYRSATNPDEERFSELPKLKDKKHKDELFTLIRRIKEQQK